MPKRFLPVPTVLLFTLGCWQVAWSDESKPSATPASGKSPPAAGEEMVWLQDVAAAGKKAVADKKGLMILFTGTTWGGPCALMQKEIIESAEFQEWSSDRFVPVIVDFPRGQAPKELDELADRYEVDYFPALILADSKSRPYGQLHYEAGGPQAFIERMNGALKDRDTREEHFAQAEELEGVPRAKTLVAGLGEMSDAMVDRFYPEVVAAIRQLDPKDVTGYQKRRAMRAEADELVKQFEGMFILQRWGTIVKQVNDFIAKHQPSGADLQNLLLHKFMSTVELGATALLAEDETLLKQRTTEANQILDELIAADPASDLAAQADRLRPTIPAFIKERSEQRKTEQVPFNLGGDRPEDLQDDPPSEPEQ